VRHPTAWKDSLKIGFESNNCRPWGSNLTMSPPCVLSSSPCFSPWYVSKEYCDDGGCRGYQSLNNMQGKPGVLGFIWKIGYKALAVGISQQIRWHNFDRRLGY
jgi:hypothetical protein